MGARGLILERTNMLKETLLTYVLPVLIWGGVTGIINLAFGYKSQIEAWAESHPRLAALLKFTRGIGLDPWQLLSALKLFAEKKLPDAQKANSAVAKSEQRKADAKRLGGPPSGGSGVADAEWIEPEKTPPSLPGARLVALTLVASILGCSGTQLAPPCDEASLAAITAECSAKAYQCGQQGIPEAECAPMLECDERLDARAEKCR